MIRFTDDPIGDILEFCGVDNDKLHEFWKAHYYCRTDDPNNKFRYLAIHTGIGDIIKATCLVCGKTGDITDIGTW